MSVDVKICGLTDAASLETAIEAGARFVGFVFYPPSPRSLDPADAAGLAADVPRDRTKVGVTVDPTDEALAELLAVVPLDALQLHGGESPERVAAIKVATGKMVIKALSLADPEDLAPVDAYAEVADMLLFDAKPPREPDRLPGGNGLAFDWHLLHDLQLERPWFLSGGLTTDNLATAVELCTAHMVDVSSGVEARPGQKDPAKIRRFLDLAATLGPSA